MNPDSQNIFILLLVAVITGFVLPSITKAFEVVFVRRVEKKTELRNKQLEILEQLTKYIWEWRFLGKQVCLYGCNYKSNPERFRLAVKDYNERVWSIFTEIKAIKSRSIVWYSGNVPDEIEALYEFIKTNGDTRLRGLIDKADEVNLDLLTDFFKLQKNFRDEISPAIERHIKNIAEQVSKATS